MLDLRNLTIEAASLAVGRDIQPAKKPLMRLKYIVFEKDGIEDATTFGDHVSHDTAAKGYQDKGYKIVSAGFCKFEAYIQCGGTHPAAYINVEVSLGSTSLGLSSRREDVEILSNLIGRGA